MTLQTALACLAVISVNLILWRLVNPRNFGQDVAGILCMADHALRGRVRLYGDCFPSSPGLYLHFLVFIKLFGKTNHKAFIVFSAFITGLTGVAATITGTVVFGPLAGLASGLLMVAYLTSPRINGNWGTFEQLMVMPISLSLAFISLTPSAGGIWLPFAAGLCLGYATLIRLFAVVYLPAYLMLFWGIGLGMSQAAAGLAGLVLVQIMPIAWFAIKGRAGGYLATYYLLPFFFSLSPKRYRQEYQTAAASQVKNISKLNWTNAAKFSRSLSPLLLLAAAGLIMGVGHSWWPWSLTCLLGITASSLLILLRGEAYPQYWQNFLIWLCLPAGGALAQTVRAMSWPPAQPAPWLALFGLAWLFIKAIRDDRSFYYWGKNQYGWLKKAHGENMVRIYQAYRQLAVRIKENTDPEDSILLAGNPMQVLLYCQRDHFLPEFNQTTDCLQGLYKDKNTSPLQPINHWLGFDIAPPRTNPFNSGQPALIISADGNNNPAGWQKLLKAPLEQVPEFPDLPVWRVNREAKDLLELYTTPIDHEDAMPQINKYRRQLVTSFDSKNWEGVDQALRFLIKMDPQARLEYTFLLGDYLSMQNKLNLFIYICEKLVNLKIFGGEQAVILTKKAELLLIKSKSDSP